MNRRLLDTIFAWAVVMTASSVTWAGGNNGTDCWNPGDPPIGPDLIVGDISDASNYPGVGDMDAFILSPVYCNIGSDNVSWVDNTPQHPIAAKNLFRLKNNRFEQIGQSWVYYSFAALAQDSCGCGCNGQGGSVLGVGCSNVYCCGTERAQGNLGPKSEINAFTGEFPEPPANPPYSGSIARRLQVHISDLDPAQDGGGLYFGEVQVVAPDDSAFGNQNNNATYRPMTFSAGNWNAGFFGSAMPGRAGIRAWKDNDPEVAETDVFVPNEGLMILAAKATDLGDGFWHYEYAVQNLNSDRSAGSFSVPVGPDATVRNIGFHDVDYHSGEPFDGTDWTATRHQHDLTWSTTLHDVDPHANALRWGTLYNFRFDADVPPSATEATIGLFKPGTPNSVAAATVGPSAATVPLLSQVGAVVLVILLLATGLATLWFRMQGSSKGSAADESTIA